MTSPGSPAYVEGLPVFPRTNGRGNDLWPLFPALKMQASSVNSAQEPAPSACVWCLCASRWYEAVKAAASHPLGDQIVPRVVLEATHERALQDGRFTKDEVVKYAADITDGDASPAPGQGGQLQ
ncbi:hypothetical protein JCM8202v2_003708 [Rhodotorula sphaerocarpa]